jgi:diacylglycerol kinase
MKSFRCAFAGIWHAVKTERNFRIHIAAVFYVVLGGLLLFFSIYEWAWIALACGLVFGAELVNTALERLCDDLKPGHSPVIKTVKDLAAGAVLVCALAAAGMAVALFWEPVYLYLQWWELSDLTTRPEFWIGVIALPGWIWFVFGFGRGKK